MTGALGHAWVRQVNAKTISHALTSSGHIPGKGLNRGKAETKSGTGD